MIGRMRPIRAAHLWAIGALTSGLATVPMYLWASQRLAPPGRGRIMLLIGSGIRPFNVPIELLIAWGFIACLALQRSPAWSSVLSTILFGVGIGLVADSPANVHAWVTLVCGFAGALVSVRSGGISANDLRRRLSDDARTAFRTGGAWRVATFVLAAVLANGWIADDIEAARAERRRAQDVVDRYVRERPSDSRPLQIELYIDYQCPACARLIPEYGNIVRTLREAQESVEVVVRDFPLDTSCNEYVPRERNLHPAACSAAAAVRLVRKSRSPEAARTLADWFYANQRGLDKTVVLDQLRSLGLEDEFRASESELLKEVREDLSRGYALGVRATPSIVIRGQLMPFHSAADLRRVLEAEFTVAQAQARQ
jgi:protein-disulfide isomerase